MQHVVHAQRALALVHSHASIGYFCTGDAAQIVAHNESDDLVQDSWHIPYNIDSVPFAEMADKCANEYILYVSCSAY